MSYDAGTSPLYIFVVDTEDYAGNFERQLVAHMTGQVGECEVGETEAEVARTEIPKKALKWFEDHTSHEPDEENGCHRPAAIWTTPGWFNNGNGKFYRHDSPEGKKIKLKDKYPAFMSVACFFTAVPPDDILKLMQERAKTFKGSKWQPAPKITGFRLLSRETVYHSIKLGPEGIITTED